MVKENNNDQTIDTGKEIKGSKRTKIRLPCKYGSLTIVQA
jgi:hypothetical protein